MKMKQHRHTCLLLCIGFVVTILIGGCGLTDPGQNDEEHVRDLISSSGLFGSLQMVGAGSNPDGFIGFALYKWSPETRFKRNYRSHRRDIEIEIEGPHASAVIEHELDGLFTVHADDSYYDKTIELDRGMRKAEFEKVGDEGPWNGWRITQVSVLQGHSTGQHPIIHMIRVTSESTGEVVFEPGTDLMYSPGVLSFAPSEEVVIDVVLDSSDNYVILHHLQTRISDWSHKLFELIPEEEQFHTFSGTFTAPSEPGEYNNFIDVMTEGTVDDPVAAYAAAAWGMPYIVE
jgi:hypothetical protein